MGNHPAHIRWREKHKEHIKEYNRKYSSNLRQTRTEHWLVLRAKERAKRNSIPFDLDETDIFIPSHCPVLGIPLFRNVGENKPGDNSPSIDRFIPELGYIKGNISIISHRANILKRDATIEEIKRLYEYVIKQSS